MAVLLVLAVCCLTGVLTATTLQYRAHLARLRRLETVVHVNGIRGKSTVTRLVHGALAESGRRTVAKTTGTYACVIAPDASEHPIVRRYAPNILEQFTVFRRWITERVDAMVVECMAVRPEYQEFCQDKIVRADIVVITNVRIDHQEEMGETLEEIAASLCSTMPRGGTVVTGEGNPDVLAVLREKCDEAGTQLVVADPTEVPAEHLAGYRYLQFAENVAVGLEVCRLLGIDDETALAGMLAARPDPGMVTVDTVEYGGKRVHWVPAFAVNDRESTISVLDEVDDMLPEGCPKIALLNNRSDRGPRAELFADIVCEDVPHHFAKLALLGDLERPVGERVTAGGWDTADVLRLGAATGPSLDELLTALVHSVPGSDVALVGMVNIHSAQAEMLLAYFEHAEKVAVDAPVAEATGSGPRDAMGPVAAPGADKVSPGAIPFEQPDAAARAADLALAEQSVAAAAGRAAEAENDRALLAEYEYEFAEHGVDVHDDGEMARLGVWTPAVDAEYAELERALRVLSARDRSTTEKDD